MSLPRDLSFTFPHALTPSTKSPLRTPLLPTSTTTEDITALPPPPPSWTPHFSTLLAHPPSDLALRHPNPKPVPRVPGTSSETHVNIEGGEKLMGGRREKRRASSLDFEPWCAPDGGAGGRGGREGEKGRCEGGRGKEYGEYEDWELEEVARRLRGELKVVEGELGRRRRAKKGEKKVKKREKKMKEGKKEEGTVFQRVRGWFGRKGGGKMQIGVPKDAQKHEWPEEIREAYYGMR